MIYKKPNLKYTEMAIWVDEHVYTDDCDDNTLFEYIYHLVNMLAHQAGYFKNYQYYDDFALSGATRVFLRLRNAKQFEYLEDGTPKLEKIKSVLNYIKSIIYPMKVVFEQENYCQIKPFDSKTGTIMYDVQDSLRDYITESVDKMNTLDFNLYLRDISKTARAFMDKIPHKRNSDEWLNIYLSCLLTFLNSVTLSNKNKENIKLMGDVLITKPDVLNKMYKEERENSVILFHLDESMRSYIIVLTNRLKHLISSDLSSESRSYISSDMTAKNLLMSSLGEEEDGYR